MDIRKDASVMTQIQAAILELYQKYIIEAAAVTKTQLDYVPNQRFTTLVLGTTSLGKSSFINYFIGQKLLKTGRSTTTDEITFVVPDVIRQTLKFENGKKYFLQVADEFERQTPDVAARAIVEVYGHQQDEQESIFKSLSDTFCVEQKPTSPFLFIDSPGFSPDTPQRLVRALEALALKADCILIFLDEHSPIQTLKFAEYCFDAGLDQKMFMVKSKFDELDHAEDIIRSFCEVSQNISRVISGRPFRLYPIALPQFVDQKRFALLEQYVKDTKQQELQQKQEQVEQVQNIQQNTFQSMDAELTNINQTMPIVNYKVEEAPVFIPQHLNQLQQIEDKMYSTLNATFQKSLTQFDKDVKDLSEKLELTEADHKMTRQYNCAKMGLTTVCIILIIYAICVLFAGFVTKYIGPINNQLYFMFLQDNLYIKMKKVRVTILCCIAGLVLTCWLLVRSIEQVDLKNIKRIKKDFQEQLLTKVDKWIDKNEKK